MTNWPAYDASLRQRGSLTVWFTDDARRPAPVGFADTTPWDRCAVASFTGDGAYDRDRVYAGVAQRHPDADVVVPPRSTAVPSDTAETAPTQRDRHLQNIAEHGSKPPWAGGNR